MFTRSSLPRIFTFRDLLLLQQKLRSISKSAFHTISSYHFFRPKLILDMRGKFNPGLFNTCPGGERCAMTQDQSLAEVSDAIIFCVADMCQTDDYVRMSFNFYLNFDAIIFCIADMCQTDDYVRISFNFNLNFNAIIFT